MSSADSSERVRAADGAAVALALLAADTWASATPVSSSTSVAPGAPADPATAASADEWVSREETSAAADGLVDQVIAAERLIGWARAQQFRTLAGLSQLAVWPAWAEASRKTGFGDDWGGNPAMVLAEMELSAALPWSRHEAGHRLSDALEAADLPQVLHLLEAGAFNETQARAVRTTITDHLSREKGETPAQLSDRKAKVETAVLAAGVAKASTTPDPAPDQDPAQDSAPDSGARGPRVVAETRTAAQLRKAVLKAVLQADPEAAERRRLKAAENREVRMWARKDGMASIEALLSAESAAKVDQALNLMADAARNADRRAIERVGAAGADAASDNNAAAVALTEPDAEARTEAGQAADPQKSQKHSAASRFAHQRTHQQRRADAMTGIFSAILDGRPLPMYPTQTQPAQPGQPAATQPSPSQPSQPSAASPGRSATPADDLVEDDTIKSSDHDATAESAESSESADGGSNPNELDYQVDTDNADDADEDRLIDEHEMTDWAPAGTDDGVVRDPFAGLPATGTSTGNLPCMNGATGTTGASVSGPVLIPAWWEPPHLPTQQRRRAHLVITISYDTLLGRDNLPADLAGYGAITAQAARDLAKHAGTADLLILGQPPHHADAATRQPGGPPIPIPKPDRTFGQPPQAGYRPRNDLLREVILRHQTCRAPSCSRPAEQCDADHLVSDAEGGGQTVLWNLIPLCRRHHLLKTHGGWNVRWATPDEGVPGTLHWTSPLGRTHLVPPNERPGTTPQPANTSQPESTGQTVSTSAFDGPVDDATEDTDPKPGYNAA